MRCATLCFVGTLCGLTAPAMSAGAYPASCSGQPAAGLGDACRGAAATLPSTQERSASPMRLTIAAEAGLEQRGVNPEAFWDNPLVVSRTVFIHHFADSSIYSVGLVQSGLSVLRRFDWTLDNRRKARAFILALNVQFAGLAF